MSRPSLPPASPHRAGHYSGLHPEDQPYQSAMIAVQRPPARDTERLPSSRSQKEPERLLLPMMDAPTQVPVRREAPPNSPTLQKPQISRREEADIPTQIPIRRKELLHPQPETGKVLALPAPSQGGGKPLLSGRVIPVLVTLSCIFFLLASGIIVFAVTMKPPAALPKIEIDPDGVRPNDTFTINGQSFTPSTVVKFAYDQHVPFLDSGQRQLQALADSHGMFSVDILVPATWQPGQHTLYATNGTQQTASTTITVEQPSTAPPQLHLSTTRIDLGTDRAGTTSSKQVTLQNVGGGEVTWQQSSDAPWLTTAPISNSYIFSGSTLVTITANRSNLTPQRYIGQITFTQKDSSISAKLMVTMQVNPKPAALSVSTSVLTFSATPVQAAPLQSVILQNTGGTSLNWQATTHTDDGANWLYISQASGSIDPNTSKTMNVNVQAQQLSVGTYQGTITLSGGASATINVSLTVIAPGNILVSPSSLTFAALTGQSPASKAITLQNSGGESMDWTASVGTVEQGNWLSITPASGSVGQGGQVTVTVTINSASLKAGAYQGIITFTGANVTQQVPISLTMTTPPAAAISVQGNVLNFVTTQGLDPTPQTLTITNTGNATLNWIASESGNGATFAPVSPAQGSLLPQAHQTVVVTPVVSSYSAGTPLTTTITVADSDTGTAVVAQKVPVTITIQRQANISLSQTNLSLNATTNTAMVTITNTGNATLNWVAVVQTDATTTIPWLSVDTQSGTLAPNQSKTIQVSCSSTNLTTGTSYGGQVVIKDSDAGTTVIEQTVYVTFIP